MSKKLLTLGALGLGLGGLMLLSQDAHAKLPPDGELTFEKGDVTGTDYMVMLGNPGKTGRQVVSVFNTNQDLVLVYVQNIDGTNRSVVNSRPNPNLAGQSDLALQDFGFKG